VRYKIRSGNGNSQYRGSNGAEGATWSKVRKKNKCFFQCFVPIKISSIEKFVQKASKKQIKIIFQVLKAPR
jgi:hypothetical protein